MNVTGLARELAGIVGAEWVMTSRSARELYSYDSTIFKGLPDLVVLPGNVDEVSRVLQVCYREKVPVHPRAAGTCLSGGTIPVNGGVALVLTRMNRLLSFDPVNRVAVVEPAFTNLDLQKEAAPYNLTFPPDPSSQKASTIGGNTAENSGGPHAAKYGVTRNYVIGVEYVTPDGRIGQVGHMRPIPCPDLGRPLVELVSLLVGSEGSLAIITKVAVRLAPIAPKFAALTACFPSVEAASRTVSQVVAAGMVPVAMEIMGHLDINLVEEFLHLGLPRDAGAMLVIEVDGPGPSIDRQAEIIEQIARRNQGTNIRRTTDPLEKEKLWLARRSAAGTYGRVKPTYITQDIAVPRNRIPDMFRKVSEIADQINLPIGILGHMGDGNLHPAILLDDQDPDEMRRAIEAGHVILEEALRLGGVLTGEHGVGLEKIEFMHKAFPIDSLRYFARVKRAFDPNWQLNPGKAVPEVQEEPAPSPTPEAAAPTPARAGRTGEDAALKRLQDLLGDGLITDTAGMAEFGFGPGRQPAAVAVPQDREQVVEIIKILREAGVPAWPVGRGTFVRQAFAPFQGGVGISTARLQRLVDLNLENLTAIVEAGVTAEQLNAVLREKASGKMPFFFPTDPWRFPGATIGGEVGINAYGPNRPLFGSTRDQLLGMTFVDAGGRLCRVGGQTIKNVTGFDVSRLLCGAWGTLGVMVDATLRLWPCPETEETFLLPLTGEGDADLIREIRDRLEPASLQVLGPHGELSEDRSWNLAVRLMGMEEDVRHWAAELESLVRARGVSGLRALDASRAQDLWNRVRRWSGPAMGAQWREAGHPWVAGYVWAAPTRILDVAHRTVSLAEKMGWKAGLSCFWAQGLADFTFACGAEDGPRVAEFLRALSVAAEEADVGLYAWADELEEDTASWHPRTKYHPVTAAVISELKKRVDPAHILAPTSRAL